MRFILFLSLLLSSIFASNTQICKNCHPSIYKEFLSSFHKNSTLKNDKIHRAIWKLHPNSKKNDYTCAKCHSPQKDEGVSCLTCHKIVDIKEHAKANENIYEKNPKILYSAQKGMEDKIVKYHQKSSWFGLFKKSVGSPYHDIDYRNKNYYTGKVCMGCHSHKQNSHNFTVCETPNKGASSTEQNCITCHMPQVKGSATTIRESKTHAYHGFSGVHNADNLLEKYIDLSLKKESNGFSITIKNNSPHDLFTHALRVAKLKSYIKRDDKKIELKEHTFIKVLGNNSKPVMPWSATQILKDTMIKANESRVIEFNTKLQKGDEVNIVLGYHIVNPKAAKKLKLEEFSDFKELKRLYLKVE